MPFALAGMLLYLFRCHCMLTKSACLTQVPFPKADSGHVMGSTQGSPQFVPDRGSMVRCQDIERLMCAVKSLSQPRYSQHDGAIPVMRWLCWLLTLRQLAKQDGSRGLVFRWDTLRLLYFFGGNGETRLRIDAHGVSSTIRVPVDSPQTAADSYQVLIAGYVCAFTHGLSTLPAATATHMKVNMP
jgi:hypothetical protein